MHKKKMAKTPTTKYKKGDPEGIYPCPVEDCQVAFSKACSLNLHKVTAHQMGRRKDKNRPKQKIEFTPQPNQDTILLDRYTNPHTEENKATESTKEADQNQDFTISTTKTLQIPADALSLIQFYIRQGQYKNIQDFLIKSIYAQAFQGGNNMINQTSNQNSQETDVYKQIDDMEAKEMKKQAMQTYLAKRQAEVDVIKNKSNPLPEKEGGSDMKNITKDMIEDLRNQLYFKQLKKMLNDDDNSSNVKEQSLMQEIQNLRNEMKLEQERARSQQELLNLRNEIQALKNQGNKNSDSEVFKVIRDSDQIIKQRELALMDERSKNQQDLLNYKMQQLEQQLKNSNKKKSNYEDLLEEIETIKELGKKLGVNEEGKKETPAMEYIENIGKAVLPTFDKILDIKKAQIEADSRNQGYYPQQYNDESEVQQTQSEPTIIPVRQASRQVPEGEVRAQVINLPQQSINTPPNANVSIPPPKLNLNLNTNSTNTVVKNVKKSSLLPRNDE